MSYALAREGKPVRFFQGALHPLDLDTPDDEFSVTPLQDGLGQQPGARVLILEGQGMG